MHSVLTHPLTDKNRLERRKMKGVPVEKVVAQLVKAGEKLQPVERVEIYNRMYWFRLLEAVASDCPGLQALLGEQRFGALSKAYLAKYPSRSFTLRNLCARLPRFILEEPKWTAPHTQAAHDLARYEWAQVVAFDGPALPPLSPEILATAKPNRLRVQLQPYLCLLTLNHAADQFVFSLKQDGVLRADASNAVSPDARSVAKILPHERLRRERIHVVVHRVDNQLYFKRVDARTARLLRALQTGQSIAGACGSALRGAKGTPEELAAWVQENFALWMRLGWLCARKNKKSGNM